MEFVIKILETTGTTPCTHVLVVDKYLILEILIIWKGNSIFVLTEFRPAINKNRHFQREILRRNPIAIL